MNETPLDPKREQMIAALYGELEPDEMDNFLATLEKDEGLKREWAELRETRTFLQHADQDARPLQFRFLMPAVESVQPASGSGRFRHLLLAPATGFAATALALIILMMAGLRIDVRDGALMVHFGGSSRPNTVAGLEKPTLEPTDTLIMDGGKRLVPTPASSPEPGVRGRRVGATDDLDTPLTRTDLAVFADQILRIMDDRMRNSYQEQRGEFIYLLNELTQSLHERERVNRVRLDSRFENVLMGVAGLVAISGNIPQARSTTGPADVGITPVQQTTPNREESGKND